MSLEHSSVIMSKHISYQIISAFVAYRNFNEGRFDAFVGNPEIPTMPGKYEPLSQRSFIVDWVHNDMAHVLNKYMCKWK